MERQPVDSSGAGRGTLKSYATGFVLSLTLTVLAFGLVMRGALPLPGILFGIIGAAVVQIVVQMHYFLHLDASSSQRWNVMVLVYTVLIIAILVGGTLWIMFNMRDHMMAVSMLTGH
ncbi:MAG: cytochrome o ubiquinol oxidase subunit IV [Betaproteobacteria bacterium]|nr:cytochrome o ubiquinol oxidase subunit IV [Betaproteobacteria bacterium]